jgi:hypothetical protein
MQQVKKKKAAIPSEHILHVKKKTVSKHRQSAEGNVHPTSRSHFFLLQPALIKCKLIQQQTE